MPRRPHLTRSHAILRIKGRLEQGSFPRIQMSLIVGLTGAAGLLFSFVTCLTIGDRPRFRRAITKMQLKGPGSN
jgi:hypothetical protein